MNSNSRSKNNLCSLNEILPTYDRPCTSVIDFNTRTRVAKNLLRSASVKKISYALKRGAN